ncbi:MAG: hypothetical protein IJD51_01130 [Clostridia bacterium]|nr:hypothetical protein [Clostridia bacterium]
MKKRNIELPEFSSPLLSKPDPVRFLRAREAVIGETFSGSGIGTLSEKSLHRILKCYIEPDVSLHEVEFGGSVLDIKNSEGIFEVQTRGYDRLAQKLSRLLPTERVSVVCPLATDKTVRWLDPTSGEITEPRHSPKRECVFDAFKMLFGIRSVIAHENLSVRLMYLRVEEFRSLNGYGTDKKRRSTRLERIPTEIIAELTLRRAEDYASLLPSGLAQEFVASEFSRLIKRTSRYTFYILKLLVCVGAIAEAGKRGRAQLYRKCYPEP